MKYRKYKQEDEFQVTLLCREYEIEVPTGFILVAEDDDGKIIGIISMKAEIFIEPLISKNPMVTNKLFSMMEGILLRENIPEVKCICDKDKEDLFNRVGFEVVENNKLIMKKNME